MRTQCMAHICTHAYRYASICRLGLAACMSDARPRPLNARFRSTESAAVDSFENPKIPTPNLSDLLNLVTKICPKTDFIINKLLIKNVLLC